MNRFSLGVTLLSCHVAAACVEPDELDETTTLRSGLRVPTSVKIIAQSQVASANTGMQRTYFEKRMILQQLADKIDVLELYHDPSGAGLPTEFAADVQEWIDLAHFYGVEIALYVSRVPGQGTIGPNGESLIPPAFGFANLTVQNAGSCAQVIVPTGPLVLGPFDEQGSGPIDIANPDAVALQTGRLQEILQRLHHLDYFMIDEGIRIPLVVPYGPRPDGKLVSFDDYLDEPPYLVSGTYSCAALNDFRSFWNDSTLRFPIDPDHADSVPSGELGENFTVTSSPLAWRQWELWRFDLNRRYLTEFTNAVDASQQGNPSWKGVIYFSSNRQTYETAYNLQCVRRTISGVAIDDIDGDAYCGVEGVCPDVQGLASVPHIDVIISEDGADQRNPALCPSFGTPALGVSDNVYLFKSAAEKYGKQWGNFVEAWTYGTAGGTGTDVGSTFEQAVDMTLNADSQFMVIYEEGLFRPRRLVSGSKILDFNNYDANFANVRWPAKVDPRPVPQTPASLPYACGRKSDGVYCSKSNGGTAWTSFTRWLDGFRDDQGFGDSPSYWATMQFPDLNRDDKPDVCMRGSGGIYCGLSDGAQFTNVNIWACGGQSCFANAEGWNAAESYWRTIQFPDVNGDERSDICGRAPPDVPNAGSDGGIVCALSTGTEFGPLDQWDGEFSDLNGWGNAPSSWQTIQFPDVDGDGRADVCGRANEGIYCALASTDPHDERKIGKFTNGCNSTGLCNFYWLMDFANSGGWNGLPSYWGTIQFPDLNGDHRADICGRSSDGIYCAYSHGEMFDPPILAENTFTNANGWDVDPTNWETLQFPDVNGDGSDDVCGRANGGVYCRLAGQTVDGSGRAVPTLTGMFSWQLDYSDANGWDSHPSHWGSLRFADLNGDGMDDVCGRGAGGLYCVRSTGSSLSDWFYYLPDLANTPWKASGSYWGTIQLTETTIDKPSPTENPYRRLFVQ